MNTPTFAAALHEARAQEKEQAQFYRALSAQAEQRGLLEDVEALNGLLADEQHHLSRISVRLVELGQELRVLEDDTPAASRDYEHWHDAARERERREVARYEELLALPLDEETAGMIRSILETERQHEQHLAGKYTNA